MARKEKEQERWIYPQQEIGIFLQHRKKFFFLSPLTSFLFFLFFFFFFWLVCFRAALVAYGSSQARGQIKLDLPAYLDLSRAYDLHYSLWQCWILNPLSEESQDWTHILTDISLVCYCWATRGTPRNIFIYIVHSGIILQGSRMVI